jgi:hypothetical protein
VNTKHDTNLDSLEQMLEGELKCESIHGAADNKTCSLEVVAKKFACDISMNICGNSAAWNLGRISDPRRRCRSCGYSCQDCWKVIPI